MMNIKRVSRSRREDYKSSVIIPTWNNLPYLKLCIESILQNSHFAHQIIVVVNEGVDGSLEWIRSVPEVDYVHFTRNMGVCYSLNSCRQLIKTDYITYVNDDMYLLPDWDKYLWREIDNLNDNLFLLSATAIEPFDSHNSCVIVGNYGKTVETFEKEALLREFKQLEHRNWQGSTWPPIVVHLDVWDLVGGMSVEFSPGMGSDPDLVRKLWDLDVRYFKGISDSRVYHFGSKSTRKIRKNNGRRTFLFKWGISSNTFMKKYIRRGEPFQGSIEGPKRKKEGRFAARLKMLKYLFS